MTFFRTCIYICLMLIMLTLAINFVDGTGAYGGIKTETGVQTEGEEGILSAVTGLEDSSMNTIWLLVSGAALTISIGLAWLTHSITPVGIYLFGQVFWTSYLKAWTVMGAGGFTDDISGLMLIFTVGIGFVFIAAVVGMLTGSG